MNLGIIQGQQIFTKDEVKAMEKLRLKGDATGFWNFSNTLPRFQYQLAIYLSKYLNDTTIIDETKMGDNTHLVQQYCDLKTYFNELLFSTTLPHSLTTIKKKEQYFATRATWIRQNGQKELKLNRLSEKMFLSTGIDKFVLLLTQFEEQDQFINLQQFLQLQQITVLCSKIVLIFAPLIDEAINPKLYQLLDKKSQHPKLKNPIKNDSFVGMSEFYQNLIQIIHYTTAAVFKLFLQNTASNINDINIRTVGQNWVNLIFYIKMYAAKYNRQNDVFYDGLYVNLLSEFITRVYTPAELFSEQNVLLNDHIFVKVAITPGNEHDIQQPCLIERYIHALITSYNNQYQLAEHLHNAGGDVSLVLLDEHSQFRRSSQTLPPTSTAAAAPTPVVIAAPSIVMPGGGGMRKPTPVSPTIIADDERKPERSRIGSFFRRKSISKLDHNQPQHSMIQSSVINNGNNNNHDISRLKNIKENTYGPQGSVIEPSIFEFNYQTQINNFIMVINIFRKYMAMYYETYATRCDAQTNIHVINNFLSFAKMMLNFVKLHSDHMMVFFDQHFNFTDSTKEQPRNIRNVFISPIYDVFNKIYIDIIDDDAMHRHKVQYAYKLKIFEMYKKTLESVSDLSTHKVLDDLRDSAFGLDKDTQNLVDSFIILHDNIVHYEQKIKDRHTQGQQQQQAEREEAERQQREEEEQRKQQYLAYQQQQQQEEEEKQKQENVVKIGKFTAPVDSVSSSPSALLSSSSQSPSSQVTSIQSNPVDPDAKAKAAELIKQQTTKTQQKIFLYNCIAVVVFIFLAIYFNNTSITALKYGLPLFVILSIVGVVLQYMQNKQKQQKEKEEEKKNKSSTTTNDEKQKVAKYD